MPDSTFDRTAARADLCRLLAACYYQPGPEFAEEMLFDSMREAAEKIDAGLATQVDAVADAFNSLPLEPLEVDYTRLFLNPDGALAAPYESVWMGGRDPVRTQEVIEAVVRFYAEAGFEMDEGFRDLPDHIAAQLEFLYALIFRDARDARTVGTVSASEMTAAPRVFVEQHLGRWVGPFASAMRAGAETAFYRKLADLTERFVGLELR